MAKTNFYSDADVTVISVSSTPTQSQWREFLFTDPQAEFEKRWSTAQGFYTAPTCAIDSGNDKVDCTALDAIVFGNRVTATGNWQFAAQASGTYYLQVSNAGAYSAATTEDAAKLTVATVDWNLATTTLTNLSLTGNATNAIVQLRGSGSGTGSGTLLQNRGSWTTSYAYTGTASQKDIVVNDGASYMCILSHTSAAGDEPGTGASWTTYWQLLASKGDAGATGAAGAGFTPHGVWVDGHPYVIGDGVVGTDGNGYIASTPHTGSTPTRPIAGADYADYWTYYVAKGGTGDTGATGTGYRDRGDWAAGVSYVNSATYIDTVTNENTIWKCILSHTSSTPDEPGVGANYLTDWERMIAPGENEPAVNWYTGWTGGTAYIIGDRVYNDGSTFRCILGHTASAGDEPGTGASWETYWMWVARKGDTGATGAAGADGADGADGAQGPAGLDGSSVTYRGTYNGATTYANRDVVKYLTWTFVSLQGSNTGNTPDTTQDTAWWGRMNQDGSGTGTPADTVAAQDGTGAAGSASEYSRGDHKHGDTARHSQNTDAGTNATSFNVRQGQSDVTKLTPQAYLVDYAQTTALNLYMVPYSIFAVRDTTNHAELTLGGPYVLTDNANNWLVVDYADLTIKVIQGAQPSQSDYHTICAVNCAGGVMTVIDPWPHPSAQVLKPGSSATDTNAIHDNVAGEIAAITAKATPVAADLLIIEDSADSNNKKQATAQTIARTLDAASDSVAGKVELATAAETTTGTDATRAITPDGLAGSDFGKRVVVLKVLADGTDLTTGDGKMYFTVPALLNGMNLVDVDACVYTASTAGGNGAVGPIQVYNVTDAQDMLSTGITLDQDEFSSYTAATAPVINASYDDVATGDRLRIDVDTAAGTGTKGLELHLTFQLP